MLLTRAELAPGRVRDVRVVGATVTEVGTELRAARDEDVIDAAGAAVLPGLHDHHVHLRSTAAAHASLDLATVRDTAALQAAIGDAAAGLPEGAWLRVIGYHESIAGDLERAVLDLISPAGRPVRVQHRSGVLWVLNSAALDRAGLGDHEQGVDHGSGRIWRRDDLVRGFTSLDPAALGRVGADAARLGVTGFTDATAHQEAGDARELARALRRAGVAQGLHLMGPVGAAPPDVERATLGPVKVILDDDRLPPLDALADHIRSAHAEARPVALHCVTRVQLVLALAAIEAAGSLAGDRIEHASVTPPELVAPLAELGLTVVTQPHFVTERGDQYLADVDPRDRDSLYRLRSLVDAGVAVAAGTDAPFGAFDPWASIAAALRRRTRDGHPLGPAEAVTLERAVALYLGRPNAPGVPRTVEAGSRADLCMLAVSWAGLADALHDAPVRCTIIGGEPVHMA